MAENTKIGIEGFTWEQKAIIREIVQEELRKMHQKALEDFAKEYLEGQTAYRQQMMAMGEMEEQDGMKED